MELLALLEILVLYLLAHLRNGRLLSVVVIAIFEHKLDISEELLHAWICVVLQILLYRSKIHGFSDDVKVVVHIMLLWLNWLVEDPSFLVLHQV